MPQQKLNLLQFPALRSAELRRRPPQIMRRQLADPDSYSPGSVLPSEKTSAGARIPICRYRSCSSAAQVRWRQASSARSVLLESRPVSWGFAANQTEATSANFLTFSKHGYPAESGKFWSQEYLAKPIRLPIYIRILGHSCRQSHHDHLRPRLPHRVRTRHNS